MTTTSREVLPSGPTADGVDAAFWEGLQAGGLVLPRCADCGQWRSPGRPICAACWSFSTAWEEVEASGSIHTWIRSHRDFMSELDVAVPYVTVLVELDDVLVRLLGILTGAPERDPAIGDRVVGMIEHPTNSEWPILRWRPAAAA